LRTYVNIKLDVEDKIIYQPDFTCADLRKADFSGFPLFAFISEKSVDYFTTPLSVQQPVFVNAKLDDTDFRHIRQFGSVPLPQPVDTTVSTDKADVAGPFGVCDGSYVEAEQDGKRFALYEYSTCDWSPESKDLGQFKTSIDFIFDNLSGSTWMNASYPPGMLDALKARVGPRTGMLRKEPPPVCRPFPAERGQ
jgi:hypothetical protein